MNRWVRVALAIGLLVALFGLGSYAEASEAARSNYPTMEELGADFDSHVGEDALLFGTVESIDEGGATIRVTDDDVDMRVRVTEFDASVEPGGVVQVFGRLREGQTIDPHQITVVNPSETDGMAKYVISAVAGALFLAIFLRDWRIDLRNATVRKRSENRTGGRQNG